MIWKRFVLFLSLFCAFGLSLILLPSQVQAYEIATPVNPTGNAWDWGASTQWNTTFATPLTGNIQYYTNQQNASAIFINKNGAGSVLEGKFILNSIKSSNGITFKKGNYYSTILNFSLQSQSYTYAGESFPSVNRINLPNNAPYKVMSISSSYVPCAGTSAYSGFCSYGGVSWNIIVQATRDDVGVFQLGLPNTDMIEWILVQGANYTNYGTILAEPITEFEAIKGADSINQEQQQAGEQAQQDGQQGSSTSQTDAENASTTLLGAFNGFVGAITAISPSNCNMSGNFGHIDAGTLNFCRDSPPAFVATILSLVSVALLVPLSIHLAKRMIGLFRSFTNG